MRISDFSIANPVKVTVGVILLCMFGLVALFGVPVQMTPDVSKPIIEVQTRWHGASPQEIEKEIIEKQEEQLKSVKGMIDFQSECRVGRGEITMEFAPGTDMGQRMVDVGNALDQIKQKPPDAEEPRIETVSVSDASIAWFSLVPEPPRPDEIEALLKRSKNPELRKALEPLLVGRPSRLTAVGRDARPTDGVSRDGRPTEVIVSVLFRLYRETDEQGNRRFPELKPLVEYRVDPTLLRNFAEDVLEAQFERVDGVSAARVYGGLNQRLEVVIDPADLAKRKITLPGLRDKLVAANRNISAGDVRDQKSRYEARVLGEFDSIEEVEKVVIDERDQTKLKDIAGVRLGYAKPEGLVRQRGMPSLGISIQKEDLANVMVVMEGVQAKARELNDGVLRSRGLRLVQVHDQTTYIRSANGLVRNNIFVGGTLAVIVLLLFLRSGRSTLVVALAIPISVIGTFLIIRVLGRSINVISLAGMAFAVGMVVDSAIVVLENIFSHYQRGERPRVAASRGTTEVWGAILASTLTTLAVFVPVVFVQEQAGQLFRDIAIAISAAVALSMIVSLTVIPSAASRLLRERRDVDAAGNGEGRVGTAHQRAAKVGEAHPTSRFTRAVVWLTDRLQAGRISVFTVSVCCLLFFVGAACLVPIHYAPLPGWLSGLGGGEYLWALPDPKWLFIAAVSALLFVPLAFWARRVAVVVTMMLLAVGLSYRMMPGTEYLPEGNRNLVYARVQPPPGYSLEKIMQLADGVEEHLRPHWEPIPDPETGQLPEPRIENLFLVARDNYMFMGARAADPARSGELIELLRRATSGIPAAVTMVNKSNLFERSISGGRNIDIEIVGDDIDKLMALGKKVQSEVQRIYPSETTGTSIRPTPSLVMSAPEMHIRRNLAKAAERQMSTLDLGYTVDALVDGAYVGEYRHEGEMIDLVITAPEAATDQIQEIGQLPIATTAGDGEMVPLAAVADISYRTGPDRLVRIDRQRAVTLSVKPGEAVTLEDAMQRINAEVIEPLRKSGELKGGRYHIRLGGSADDLNKMLVALGGSMLMAVVITYLLIAALYESFLYPLVIMVSVPMAAVGGFAGLALLNLFTLQKLDTLTMLGFIILIGTVVNNAILIVNQALVNIRHYGMPHRAAVSDSVRGRIRPIFMSTLTTVLAMLPLVVYPGAGSELYRGLGSVVLGGLLLSTVFTLFLVPMLFTLLYEAQQGLRARFRPAEVLAPAEPPIWADPALVPVGGNGETAAEEIEAVAPKPR